MSETAKIEVELDTQKAETKLKAFVGKAGKLAWSTSQGIYRGIKSGIEATGVDTNFVGQFRSNLSAPTNSAVTDVISEAVSPLATQLMSSIFGDAVEEARAAKSAREQTIQVFGGIAGVTGITPGMVSYFESAKQIAQRSEHGRVLFESDTRFGTNASRMVEKVMETITGAIKQGFDYLADKLNPANWF